jgi:hypothetical protein
MNFTPLVAAVALLGVTVAQLLGVDVLPGEQTDLVTSGTAAVTGLAGLVVVVRTIMARQAAKPAAKPVAKVTELPK